MRKDANQQKYCDEFEKYVLGQLENPKLNFFKLLRAPMGSGKTSVCVDHHIPHLMNVDKRVKITIFTAPYKSIIQQKKAAFLEAAKPMKDVYFCEHPLEVLEIWEQIPKARFILAITDSMAYIPRESKGSMDKLIALIDKEDVLDAWFKDEGHAGTVSDSPAIPLVQGNSWGKSNDTYKATFYQRIKERAKKSPYIFGLSATPNRQNRGEVPTLDGVMSYEVIISMPEAKDLWYRLGWLNDVTYFEPKGLFNESKITLQKMIKSVETRWYKSGKKIGAYIKCERMKNKKDGHEKSPIADIKRQILASDFSFPGMNSTDYIVAVTTSDESYVTNMEGGSLKLDEKEIYKKYDDPNDPLTFLLVVDKASMGVSLMLAKEIMTFRTTNKSNPDGDAIIEYMVQLLGRGTRPYAGHLEKVFYDSFGGDFRSIQDFDPELNYINFYLPNNNMNTEAVKFYKKYYPVVGEIDYITLKENWCPKCGRSCSCPTSRPATQEEQDSIKIPEGDLIDG